MEHMIFNRGERGYAGSRRYHVDTSYNDKVHPVGLLSQVLYNYIIRYLKVCLPASLRACLMRLPVPVNEPCTAGPSSRKVKGSESENKYKYAYEKEI